MREFYSTALGNNLARFAFLLFLGLFGWWSVLHLQHASSDALQLWAASYQALAFYGAILGLVMSRRWGGLQSVIGRAIIAFSVGLLLQCFGQSTYSYYIYFLNLPVPYPSIGDLGYFGSIFAYLYAAFELAKASGAKVSLRAYHNKLLAILLPLLMVCLSFFIFLRGYTFDWSQPIKVFLDFGYPFGQAAYVSIAILAFLLSRKVLGGIMRLPILVFIAALIIQYFSDFTFLYEANKGIWYAGGLNDLLYSTSYFVMAIALIYIGKVFSKIEKT